jgi:hypothetical protein
MQIIGAGFASLSKNRPRCALMTTPEVNIARMLRLHGRAPDFVR